VTSETVSVTRPSGTSFLDRFFKVGAKGSTISREVIAGVTTFAAMSYVIIVNPEIVSAAGMNKDSLIITTIIAAIVGSVLMALLANLPIALAPGMGSNVIFAEVMVLQLGVSWQTGLAIILIDGTIFLILSVSRLREKIVAGFPDPIKLGIQCGLGLFIALIGLRNGGLVITTARSPIAFGHLSDPGTLLTFIGVLATPVLLMLRIRGALLLSIVAITIAGFFVPGAAPNSHLTELPDRILALPKAPTDLFLQLDFHGVVNHFFLLLPVLIYFFVNDFFGATCTLIAVCRRAGLMTPEGGIPNPRGAFASDALATMVGACIGTPTVTGYIESVTGVEAGGRTGLSALVAAGLFALALFLWPVIAIIPAQATTPALVVVGVLMMEGIKDIDPDIPETCFPPILTLLVTVCTADLMAGMGAGCFVYTLMVAGTRQWSKLSPMLLGIDAVFLIYFAVSTRLF
jgi:AGZA family xanthine/uracil permease-like MFS transporter